MESPLVELTGKTTYLDSNFTCEKNYTLNLLVIFISSLLQLSLYMPTTFGTEQSSQLFQVDN